MEVIGKITKVYDTQTGLSKNSGMPWANKDFLLEVPAGSSYKKIKFTISDQEKIDRLAVKESDKQVKVFFNINAREYQGRWYNEVRCYDVRPVDDAPQQAENTADALAAAGLA